MSDSLPAPDHLRASVDRILALKANGASRAEVRAAYQGIPGDDKVTIGLRVKTEWQVRQGWRVYFAAFPKARLLKIGISKDVAARIDALSLIRGERGELLLDFVGIFALEGWYHATFNQWRVEREWFRLCDQTRALIEVIRRDGPALKLKAA